MTRNGETEPLPTQKYFFVPYNNWDELQTKAEIALLFFLQGELRFWLSAPSHG
jgi:hypothetical protein